MSVEAIWARELEQLAGDKHVAIWDVRSLEEYQKKHFKGAQNVPYSEYEDHREEIECTMDKGMIYVLYCDRGGISMTFARELDKKGFRAKSVIGGLQAYHGKYMTGTESND